MGRNIASVLFDRKTVSIKQHSVNHVLDQLVIFKK